MRSTMYDRVGSVTGVHVSTAVLPSALSTKPAVLEVASATARTTARPEATGTGARCGFAEAPEPAVLLDPATTVGARSESNTRIATSSHSAEAIAISQSRLTQLGRLTATRSAGC